MKAILSAEPECGVRITITGEAIEVDYTHHEGDDFNVTMTDMKHGKATSISLCPAHQLDQVLCAVEIGFGDVEVSIKPEMLSYKDQKNAPLVIVGHLCKPNTSQVVFHRVYLTRDGEWKPRPDRGMPDDALRLDLPSAIQAIRRLDQNT